MKIEIKNISKKFKNSVVLSNINLTFEKGIYGLYGRNGAGKSVFLKIICGLYLPTSGQILFDGKDLNKELKYPTNLRALIEKPSFFPELSGFDNLKLLANIQKKITNKEIDEALKIVNLFDEKNKKYGMYSLGMKQKLGIAQVIMENPEIMILDEPFNGIEEATVNKLLEYFKNQNDKIILISTHIKEDLEKLTNKIYYFDAGIIHE